MKKSILILLPFLFLQVKSQIQLSNNGFEQWIGDSIPNGWQTSNQPPYNNVISTTDAHSGSKAIQITVALYGGIGYPGFIQQSAVYTGAKPALIKGWYKLSAVNGDVLQVQISAEDTSMPATYGYNDTLLTATSVYKQFSIPFKIQVANAKPNQINFDLLTLGTGTGNYPNAGTVAKIDDIQIVTQSTGMKAIQNSLPEILVYPNPGSTVTNLEYYIPSPSVVEIDLIDITGVSIKRILNEDQSSGRYRLPVIVEGFSKGFYFIRLKSDSGYTYKSLIIE